MRVNVELFLEKMNEAPVLDVRSPGEYRQGHIPGAISFPLFTDEERAEVGTLYKQVGPDAAVKRGLELVEPKMKEMYAQGISLASDKRILVHCWRGGKRSESVAWMLSLSGMEVKVLVGGYKAYRNFVLEIFDRPKDLWIIGGLTGAGKTEVLHQLGKMGEPILDLEAMANHRGSAFGGLGMGDEVTQAQFENRLGLKLHELGMYNNIWVEDESRGIGPISLPAGYWKSHCLGKLFFIELPRNVRIERLMQDYGHLDQALLRHSVERIQKRLGGKVTQQVLGALDAGNGELVVDLLLDYYDRFYMHLVKARKPESVKILQFERFDAVEMAHVLKAATEE